MIVKTMLDGVINNFQLGRPTLYAYYSTDITNHGEVGFMFTNLAIVWGLCSVAMLDTPEGKCHVVYS